MPTMDSAQAVIICNGEPPTKTFARRVASAASIVVAADGGANVAALLGVRPDVIIGDLDSATQKSLHKFSQAEIIRVTRQDNTDLEKALDFLSEKKVKTVAILASTGKRLDHTLGNLSVLWNYVPRFAIRVLSDALIAIPFNQKLDAETKIGTTVSLLPFGPCSGITLRGLKYILTNATMKVGEIGVSNVSTERRWRVVVKKGKMLAIVQADPSRMRVFS